MISISFNQDHQAVSDYRLGVVGIAKSIPDSADSADETWHAYPSVIDFYDPEVESNLKATLKIKKQQTMYSNDKNNPLFPIIGLYK